MVVSFNESFLLARASERESGGRCEFPVDLFDRLATGLQAEEIVHRPRHQEPASEIKERHRNLRQGYIRLEIIAATDDQSEPKRADDLADPAEAIGRSHAGGAQMRGPDFGSIGANDGKAAIRE